MRGAGRNVDVIAGREKMCLVFEGQRDDAIEDEEGFVSCAVTVHGKGTPGAGEDGSGSGSREFLGPGNEGGEMASKCVPHALTSIEFVGGLAGGQLIFDHDGRPRWDGAAGEVVPVTYHATD